MRRGHYVLIAGAAILVAGIVLTTVWALPLAEEIEKGTTIMQGRQVGAGQSVTATLDVEDTSRPLSIVISAWTEVPMDAIVLDPDGNEIFGTTFTEAMAEGANPTVAGAYELVITNQSTSDATIDVVFGHIPGVSEQDIDTAIFGEVLAGVAVVLAGIMVLIGGVAVVIVDRRK